MTDPAATEDTEGRANDLPGPDPSSPSLEQRVRRLEDAVATLQDTSQMEERVAERLAGRMGRDRTTGIQQSANALLDAGRHILPVAVSAMQAQARVAEEHARAGPKPLRRPWLLFDVFVEGRAMIRMYFDPRYRLSWEACLVPPAVLLLMAASWFWLSGLPLVGLILDRAIDLVLAFVAYKVLSREAQRYLETVPPRP